MDGELVFWVFFLLALMPVAAATGWLAGGVRRRRPPRPLPGLWWVCPACHSVNAPDRDRCYRCGVGLPEAPETMPTERSFSVVQRFGPRRPVEEMGASRPLGRSPGVTRPPADRLAAEAAKADPRPVDGPPSSG